MNRKVKSQFFYRYNVQCQKLQQLFEVRSFSLDTGPQSFCHSFIVMSMMARQPRPPLFQVWQVATVVVETMHAGGSKLIIKLSTVVNWELNKVSLHKCCELVKLCHINRMGSVFWYSVVHTLIYSSSETQVKADRSASQRAVVIRTKTLIDVRQSEKWQTCHVSWF